MVEENSTLIDADEQGIASDDATWILTASFIIFTMQTGFGLLESGCVTRKNEVNILIKNLVDVVFGGIAYWIFGYALQYGSEPGTNPIFGVGGFLLDAGNTNVGSTYATFIFQLSFATTATTIVSGAMAERADFTAYCIFSLVNTLTYCIAAGWVWGNHGFLAKMGYIDFAGSSAVHLLGGVCAAVSALMLGPRLRRYDGQSPPSLGNPINFVVGSLVLWWGWLGFNCGSTFGISGQKWLYAGRAAITTVNGSLSGGLVGVVWSLWFQGMFEASVIINGILAGLVGITASCAYVQPWEALLIGAIGALLASSSVRLLDYLKVDDPVGAIAVHGAAGMWGTLAVGVFIETPDKGKGLIHGGTFYLLGVQCLGIVSITLWSAVTTFLMLFLIGKVRPIRMSPWREILGADLAEHGIRHFKCYDYNRCISVLKEKGFNISYPWIIHEHPHSRKTNMLGLWAQSNSRNFVTRTSVFSSVRSRSFSGIPRRIAFENSWISTSSSSLVSSSWTSEELCRSIRNRNRPLNSKITKICTKDTKN